jgi:hypothetical protein
MTVEVEGVIRDGELLVRLSLPRQQKSLMLTRAA